MDSIDARPCNTRLSRGNGTGRVFTGLAIIVVGLVFLADNFGIRLPLFAWQNWWALFIIVGAAAPLDRALQRYRNVGTLDAQVVNSLLSALAIVMVALMFLLDLSFGRWWPLFLILGGLHMLVSNWLGEGGHEGDTK